MKLLTQAIRKKFERFPLYSTDGKYPKKVIVKFFTPDSSYTWYAVEFDGDDTFFGLVEGHETEWGYFSLKELESIRGPLGLKVERDMYFDGKVINQHRRVIAG